jgi:hypothetical protein
VTLMAALIACAGLAVDGGRIMATRREASAIAAAAARRGSEEIATADLVSGRAGIDPSRAEAAVRGYLSQAGAQGSVVASADQVVVTVRLTRSTVLLGAFGLGSVTVSATRAAAPFSGG